MQCEMCGSNTENPILISVEGVELNVCNSCSSFGKKVIKKQKKPELSGDKKRQLFEKIVHKRELIMLISEDYANIIKSAREKMGFKQIELAKKLGIRESLINSIEQGRHEPSLNFARKLEKFLNVKLVEEHREEHKQQFKQSSSKSFTLGDFIKIRKR